MYLSASVRLVILCCSMLFIQTAHAFSIEDISADYDYHEAKISPDGKHIAMTLVHQGKRRLAVLNAKTFASVGGANFGGNQEVGDFFWVNNERLVIKVLQHEPWQDEPNYYGELFAVNYDGSKAEMIYGYRAAEQSLGSNLRKKESVLGWAEIISLLPDDEKHILISSHPMESKGLISTVHKLNVYNGRMRGTIAGAPAPYASFIADAKGNLKLSVGTDAQNNKRVYLFDEEGESWSELASDEFGGAFRPLRLDASGKNLFILDDLGQDKTGLFKLNLQDGSRKPIYTDDIADITEVTFSSDKSSVYALRVDPDYPTYVMFSSKSEEAKLYKQLLGMFPGYSVSITSSSSDGNLWLIYASNDIDAGSYYLFNKETNKFSKLFSNFKHIPSEQMSESIPIQFAASDGESIKGYITYPAQIPESQSVPLVTLVHGGPHARDYWSFDREVQMLASQGYAVLRLNFRGSTGYGSNFQFASQKHWGDRVQQDIIEGTQWAIQQGGIQADKVCIMGASFGGYSAMQSAIMAPDLFKCVVTHVGVYDLQMMFEEGDIPTAIWGKAFLSQELGTSTDLLKQFSPVHNVEGLKAPVLIAHGEKDRRVPFAQAKALKKALQQKGHPFEWFVKSSESHGFFDQANRQEYFQKVAKFLSKYLK